MTTVDVGDAFELTFNTVTGATVVTSWYDQNLQPVFEDQAVAESPSGSGAYPQTYVGTAAGMWKVTFEASGAATQYEEHWVRITSVTGPPPLASVGDVQTLYGSLTVAQQGLTRYLLRAASQLVRRSFPLVDAQVTSGLLDADVVAVAVASMVVRVLRNPSGLRAQTIGPFSYTYDTTYAAGELVLTPNDAAAFNPLPTGADTAYALGTARIQGGMMPPTRRRRRGW